VVGKVPKDVEKRALVTLYKYLPSRSEQVAGARAFGIPPNPFEDTDISTVLIEDATKIKTTNWGPRLPVRKALIADFKTGLCKKHVVFFANALCLGWTKALADEMVTAILEGGGGIYIHDLQKLYLKGDDMQEVWKDWQRELTRVTQEDYRKRRKDKQSK